ncbi:MAG: MFS transporter [Lachnospiraceae bacterium]|nr:MFS transporter [Lachnospiraceae bacterium]
MSNKKKLWALAVIMISLLQMHGVGMSAMLAQIGKAFPEAPDSKIQFIQTLPALFVLLTIIPSSFLARKIKHRYLCAFGAAVVSAFAILGALFHNSVGILYLWSIVLGIGAGFTVTVGTIVIDDLFVGSEKVTVLGLQAFAASAGTMLITFISGRLVQKNWYLGYLAYLIALIPLFASLFFLKNSQEEVEAERQKAKNRGAGGAASSEEKCYVPGVIFSVIFAFMMGVIYNVLNTNIGYYLSEKGIGNSGTAGTMMTVFLLFSGLMGLVVGFLTKKIGLFTVGVGFAAMCLGDFLVSISPNVPPVVIGGMLACCGIPFVMPVVLANATQTGGRISSMALTMTLMGAQLGNFASPVLTTVAAKVFHSDMVVYRYRLAAVISFICVVCVVAYALSQKKRAKALA